MPELPEVETIVRGLRPRIRGRTIIRAQVLFPAMIGMPAPTFRELLEGAAIQEVRRRGKLIIFQLSRDHSLLVHLGMTGQLKLVDSSHPLEKHTHLVLDLGPDGEDQLRYTDPRRFGKLLLLESSQVPQYLESKKLGPEPLSLDSQTFHRLISSRRGRIKALLLHQTLVSGIGNIYADEILHRAGIHPRREACSLSYGERERLYHSMQEVLQEAIHHKGSSISDYLDAEGNKGGFQHRHRVYGRTGLPCLTCGSQVVREVVAGRGTHYCPRCQPLEGAKNT